jgi:SpoVK/Ycf46/Vps4 family AAA+-type ATPase
MPSFIKSGSDYFILDSEELLNTLPVGNYQVTFHPMKGYYLTKVASYEIQGKIYGDTIKNSARILNTFTNRENATGVLFCGKKGSGKTLQAKHICIEAAKLGISTILVNSAFSGSPFNEFIQKINIPCVLFFDEFEKIYSGGSTSKITDDDDDNFSVGSKSVSQQSLLTLMDGSFPTKKLFILTANNKFDINEFMLNRPGRIYYYIEFNNLLEEFVKEYSEDNLLNKKHISSVVKITSIFNDFNFDMLKALIEEMNRYNESAFDAIKLLNIKPDNDPNGEYSVQIFKNKKEVKGNSFFGNPYKKAISVSYFNEERKYNEYVKFDGFESFDSGNKEFLCKTKVGKDTFIAKLKRKEEHFFVDVQNLLA